MWEFKKEFICPKDTKSLKRYQQYRDYYRVKYAIAEEFNPKRILEIGVRAGYSAISFLSGSPDAEYIGLDAENGTHGGGGGPWMWWAKEILSSYDATFIECDTQKIELLDKGKFDLIHVDGDHTVKGALHDMEICWPCVNPNGAMLIDDHDYLPEVKKAINIFIENNKSIKHQYRKSLRGEMLFFKE